MEYLIKQYSLQQGALEIQYIEEFFFDFPRKKTAAEVMNRLADRDHHIVMAEAPLPDDPGTVVPGQDPTSDELPPCSYAPSSAPVVVSYRNDPAPPPVRIYEPPARSWSDVRDDAESAPQQKDGRPIYLIAFKNQDNIRAAEAYWVTGATLHFVTLQHEQRQAPLDSVDRALTYRLNRERHVDFRLPTAEW